jgi:hypothetical protein
MISRRNYYTPAELVGRRERLSLVRAARGLTPDQVESRVRDRRSAVLSKLEEKIKQNGEGVVWATDPVLSKATAGATAIFLLIVAINLGLVRLSIVFVAFMFLGALAAMVAVRRRRCKVWKSRVREAIESRACADCGYALLGVSPGKPEHPSLGPSRCPECGGRWPALPPQMIDDAKPAALQTSR